MLRLRVRKSRLSAAMSRRRSPTKKLAVMRMATTPTPIAEGRSSTSVHEDSSGRLVGMTGSGAGVIILRRVVDGVVFGVVAAFVTGVVFVVVVSGVVVVVTGVVFVVGVSGVVVVVVNGVVVFAVVVFGIVFVDDGVVFVVIVTGVMVGVCAIVCASVIGSE